MANSKMDHALQAEVGDRVAKINSAVVESEFDAVIALGYASFQYLSGYWYPYGRSFWYRPSIVVWPDNGDPVILVGRDQTAGPERDSWIEDVRSYNQIGRRPPAGVTEALVELLTDLGLDKAHIGIEYNWASAGQYAELIEQLPNAQISECDEWFDALRSIKSPAEIDIMKRAASILESGIKSAFDRAKPSWTEKQMHDAINSDVLERGASSILLTTVQSGASASGFFPTSGDAMAQFVRTDTTLILDGYFADMARMGFIGEPAADQAVAYDKQLELNRRIIESMRPGNTCAHVYETCVKGAKDLGIKLVDQPSIGLGHTIGLNSQDFPALKATEQTELKDGMIFDIEADTYGPNGELMHVEDMILVRDSGPEVITDTLDWSVLPRIK